MRGELDKQKPAWRSAVNGSHTTRSLQQVHCCMALHQDLSCPASLSVTWRRGLSVVHQTCRWYHIGKNRLRGRSLMQREPDRLEEQADRGTLWNFIVIYAKFCTWESWQTARRASMSQQHALAAKMDNSILGCTKHRQKIQGRDYHFLLGAC